MHCDDSACSGCQRYTNTRPQASHPQCQRSTHTTGVRLYPYLGPVSRHEVDGSPPAQVPAQGSIVLQAVAGAVHVHGEGAGVLLHVAARPGVAQLHAGSQQLPGVVPLHPPPAQPTVRYCRNGSCSTKLIWCGNSLCWACHGVSPLHRSHIQSLAWRCNGSSKHSGLQTPA